jgi:hypothetical protein
MQELVIARGTISTAGYDQMFDTRGMRLRCLMQYGGRFFARSAYMGIA